MKYIKTIHERILTALSKVQGKPFKPEDIDNAIYAESINLFNKYYSEYEANQLLSDYLSPFEVVTTIAKNVGVFEKPADYQHKIALKDADTGNSIELMDKAAYNNRVNDPLFAPSSSYPIAKAIKDEFYVLPTSVSNIEIIYLTLPPKPVWGYDKVGTKYQYNDSTSTDVGWSPAVHDYLVNRVLANLGIGTREPQVVEYSQIEKVQEGR